jgi:phage-related protein
MTRDNPDSGEKPLYWIGSSKKDLSAFPDQVIDDFGDALSSAQFGGKAKNAKPWKGEGPGVLEIVEDYRGDTFRAVYTVRFELAVYVLHVFQKKSKTGISTARRDQALIASRLKDAQQEYEDMYGRA